MVFACSGGKPPRGRKGKRLDPVEPERGIRAIRDERIAGLVPAGGGGSRWVHTGELVQHRQDLACAGRPRRGAPAVIGHDDLAVIGLAGGAQKAGLAGIGDPDSDSRHRALQSGEHFPIEVDKPGIRGGHVNRH